MEPWQWIDLASPDDAAARLMTCCGSPRWVQQMMRRRPFGSTDALLAAARDEWFALDENDWRDAFGHHPRIGDRSALGARFPDTAHLSSQEQAGVTGAAASVLDALAEGNREYEQRFGFTFIVCATGKTAPEMLGLLRARLNNPPEREIRIAASEQAQITALRLLASAANAK